MKHESTAITKITIKKTMGNFAHFVSNQNNGDLRYDFVLFSFSSNDLFMERRDCSGTRAVCYGINQ